jgi:ankyrin repeat protein
VFQVGRGHWKKQLPTKHLKLAERGDSKRLEALLNDSPELLNRRGPHGRTFLFEAVRKGREHLVEWLIDQGADIHLTGCYNIETIVQINPLSAARWYRRTGLVEMLIKHGASNDIFRSAFNGERGAVESGLKKDIELLAIEDPEDEIYYTPLLSFAIAGGHLELGRRLVQLGLKYRRTASNYYSLAHCASGTICCKCSSNTERRRYRQMLVCGWRPMI